MSKSQLLKNHKIKHNNLDIEVEIISKRWLKIINIEKFIKSQTAKLIKLSPLHEFLNMGVSFGVGLSLSSSALIKKINAEFRGIDKATDILSFGNLDENIIQSFGLKKAIGNNQYIYLGDLVLAYDYIEKEAQKQNKNFNDHLSHLILHGLLHLIGFDHEQQEMAKIMEDNEIKILQKLNIANPYNHEKFKKK